LPFVALAYLATQRRAAFISLAVALFLLVVILFVENRRLFWFLAPPFVFLAIIYVGIFWNSGSTLALPVQAIKSVVVPNQADASDQASNIYRVFENINTSFTIHQKPATGVGFGQKFYIVVPMADISFFTWWEYLPHNSIIWIWLKTGVGGFLVMLFLVGSAIIAGVSAFRRMPRNELRVIVLTATLYIVMHFLYAYVDISWDSQSMLYVGAMMGLVSGLVHVVEQPVPLPKKRWPWQPDPTPAPGLVD
jgi:O-antigen ligase